MTIPQPTTMTQTKLTKQTRDRRVVEHHRRAWELRQSMAGQRDAVRVQEGLIINSQILNGRGLAP